MDIVHDLITNDIMITHTLKFQLAKCHLHIFSFHDFYRKINYTMVEKRTSS